MLTQDHKRVQKLFKDFEKVDRADEEALRDVVETACLELQIHSMLEEEIFYPAVRGHAQGEEMRVRREELFAEVERGEEESETETVDDDDDAGEVATLEQDDEPEELED